MLKAHRRLSGSWNHNLEKQWGGPHHLSNLGPFGFLMVSLVKTVHVRLRTDFRWSHSLLLFSPSVVSDSATPWTEEPLASLSFTISWSLLRLMYIETMMPSNHLILCHSPLLLPSIFLSIRVFSMSQFFASSGQSIGASASATDLPVNIQGWFPLGLTGLILLRDSQEYSPVSVFRHSLLYGPLLTSIHDYWKNHSFDCTDLCWQIDVSAF